MRRPWSPTGLVLALATALPAAAIAGPECDYAVTIEGAEASALAVEIRCRAGTIAGFHETEDIAVAWITDFTAPGGAMSPDRDGSWLFAESATDLFLVTYRFDLNGFEQAYEDYDAALRVGGSLILELPHFILLPISQAPVALAIRFATPDGADAALALPRSGDAYRIDSDTLPRSGPVALGRFTRDRIPVPGPEGQPSATLTVVTLDHPMRTAPDALKRWIADMAAANAAFWHGFPVPEALLIVLPVPGSTEIPFGRVVADGGVSLLLLVGAEMEPDRLYDDWVLMHEFVHLGSPYIRDTGAWLNEGIATYFEPIIRARASWLGVESVWREWMTGMKRGLRALGPLGLREAGRAGIYWGGALFMLLADIELRARSGGTVGLEDCLVAILRQGHDLRTHWSTEAMLTAGDEAVGGRSLRDLAARYLDPAETFDLDDLWRRLGVSADSSGAVVYDDKAPLAAIRRSIVAGTPEPETR